MKRWVSGSVLVWGLVIAGCGDVELPEPTAPTPASPVTDEDKTGAVRNGCGRFVDVSGEHWAFPAIEAGAREGLLSGCATAPARFCPEAGATRAQAAALLARAASLPPGEATGRAFTDVPATHWAAPAIEAMHRAGMIAGCGGGRFCPDGVLTRAELAALVGAASGRSPLAGPPAFADVAPEHWAAGWIEAARAHGIMRGCTGDAFCPDDDATRAQLAAVVVGAFSVEHAPRCEQPPPPPAAPGRPDVPYLYQYANALYPGASCQNTSIAMVLRWLGWQGRPDDITREFGKDRAQSPAGLASVFNQLAGRAGLSERLTAVTDGTLAGLRAELDAGHPTIVHGYFTGYGHVLVAVGRDAGGYYVNDPAGTWSQAFKGGYPGGWEPTAGDTIYYGKAAFERAIATDGWSSLPLWYHRLR